MNCGAWYGARGRPLAGLRVLHPVALAPMRMGHTRRATSPATHCLAPPAATAGALLAAFHLRRRGWCHGPGRARCPHLPALPTPAVCRFRRWHRHRRHRRPQHSVCRTYIYICVCVCACVCACVCVCVCMCVVGLQVEVASPSPFAPTQGRLGVTVEFSPCASPVYQVRLGHCVCACTSGRWRRVSPWQQQGRLGRTACGPHERHRHAHALWAGSGCWFGWD